MSLISVSKRREYQSLRKIMQKFQKVQKDKYIPLVNERNQMGKLLQLQYLARLPKKESEGKAEQHFHCPKTYAFLNMIKKQKTKLQ